ncbi:MAG: rubrerythrin [Negativicutes bacterium]|nr:rubrerythrin [Negativicutes bacterium]
MKKYVRCKACGYVMDEANLKDKCPACGIPKVVFEPDITISPGRRFILDQHLHPISVHFPQVFLLLILIMPLLSLLVNDSLRAEFLIVAKLAIFALPVTVLGGILTGLFDGKMRFKKLSTPLLINKIIVAIIFQILSLAIFALYLYQGFAGANLWLIVGLSVPATGCAVYLGRAGSSLFSAILPG